LVVSVRDTGIGIPADQLAHLFEMFYQVDRSLERSTSGLGIGLTLVQRLVEMHGGRIEAQSAGSGQGSEFIVHLPTAAESPETAVPRPAAARQETIARRILVVDDNRDSAESLALLLELSGHDVRTAGDGLEALEVAERFRPDVALLDLGMPRLNGYETARRIRQQPWGRSMVLIAQTGWGQEDDRRRTREAGFDAHLTKPVDTAALLELLGRVPHAS
jgi:CheY-like chemotaxis protein